MKEFGRSLSLQTIEFFLYVYDIEYYVKMHYPIIFTKTFGDEGVWAVAVAAGD